MKDYTCSFCGVVFRDYPSNKDQYKKQHCSRKCQGLSYRSSIPREKKCLVCKKVFSRPAKYSNAMWKNRIACSISCSTLRVTGKPRKLNNKINHSAGYLRVYVFEHPNRESKPYMFEHRLVASTVAGRALLPGEQVHHINGNKKDNRPENLMIVTQDEHAKLEKGWKLIEENWHKPCSNCKRFLRVDKSNFYFRSNGKVVSICIPCSAELYRRKKTP